MSLVRVAFLQKRQPLTFMTRLTMRQNFISALLLAVIAACARPGGDQGAASAGTNARVRACRQTCGQELSESTFRCIERC
jgi:hypothetical protein